ncbi:MAG: PRC-barrel domain-containing protein, partial [Clostridiales bacterium]
MEKVSKSILGMAVYSVQEGQMLGSVKNLLIDNKEKAVLGLIVERRKLNREERVITFEHIHNIGDDVITIDKAVSLSHPRNIPQLLRQLRNPLQIIGARVFTIGGKTLGRVNEFRFNSQTGKITGLEMGGHNNNSIFKEKTAIN